MRLTKIYITDNSSSTLRLDRPFPLLPLVVIVPFIRFDTKPTSQTDNEHEKCEHPDEPCDTTIIPDFLTAFRIVTIRIRAPPLFFRIVVVSEMMRCGSKVGWWRTWPSGA